jgi:hypothetical protein
MLKRGAAVAIALLSVAGAVAQSPPEPPQAALPPSPPSTEIVKLREDVERLQRLLEQQHSQMERQIEELRKSLETRLSGLANGLDAVRISADAVKNAVVSIQMPKRPPIAIVADPSAPIVCGEQGCETTALDHCRKSGYEIAHVVNKLEKPAQWLFAFTCRDR